MNFDNDNNDAIINMQSMNAGIVVVRESRGREFCGEYKEKRLVKETKREKVVVQNSVLMMIRQVLQGRLLL